MTFSGESDSYVDSDNHFNPIYQLPPNVDEISSMLLNVENLTSFDTEEKKFALAALLLSLDPAIKAWAADYLFESKIKTFTFLDASNLLRTVEIEVIPHGMGKRFYVNVQATDNFGRMRNFLRAMKYEDDTFRRSAYANFYCPIWMKLVGNSSYLSGNILNFEPNYGITSDELVFDIDNLEIISNRPQTESPATVLAQLLEPFFQVNTYIEPDSYEWNPSENINDAISVMEVRDREAYFSGKTHATKSSTELDNLSEEERKKYEFYKKVYSDLMMDALSSDRSLQVKMMEYEVCIRNGIDSIPHQVFKLISNEENESKFDSVVSLLVNMDPIDFEQAQHHRLGPPLREHFKWVLNTFLDESQSDTLLETFDAQIGLKNVSRWIISDRIGEMKYNLKKDLKTLVSKKAESGDYIEVLSTALAYPYFQHFLKSHPVEVQKISKILIEGLGEPEYARLVKPLLES